jgi:anti-anti-sigma factor
MGGVDEKAGVEITSQDSVAIVTFKATSISDVETIAIAAGQIKDFIDKNRPGKLIFDFAGVKFFSSQVLGLLLDVRSKLQIHGGRMAISAINPQLNRVFKITNLDKIFTFFPDRQSALLAMTSSG